MGSTPSQPPYETPASVQMLAYQTFQPQLPLHSLDYMGFFSDPGPYSQQYDSHSSMDILSGFDWVFNDSIDDILPAADAITTSTVPVALGPVTVTSSRPPLIQERSLGGRTPCTPDEQETTGPAVPEDRWPMEWCAAPVQLTSLPVLGKFEQFFMYSRHFDVPPTNENIRDGIMKSIRQSAQKSPWEPISLADFPSGTTLDCFVDLYFAHFHKSTPIIHRPTFDPGKDHFLTLAIASIGACYSGLQNAMSFSNALAEAEYDPRFVRTGEFLAAELLVSLHGFSGGSKRLYELSESNRGTLLNHARNTGIFDHRFRSYTPAGTLQQRWEAWIFVEKMRRLAWAIFLHDTSSTYCRGTRPYISLMEIRAMDMPASFQHWEAESPEAWAALHPWSRSAPPSIKYSVALEGLLKDGQDSENGIFDDYQKHILLATAVRLMWDTMELEFSAGGGILTDPEGLTARRKALHAAIRTFALPLEPRPGVSRETGFDAVVQQSCLAHLALIMDADDLINYTHLVWRGQPTSGPARKVILEWAAWNGKKVRQVARTTAFVWNATRRYPFNHHLESYHSFHSGFLVWSCIPLLQALEADQASEPGPNAQYRQHQDQPEVCQLDWLGSDDSPEGQRVAQWVETGEPCILRMHGIPDLLSGQGSRQILQQTADNLERMPVWGISQVFRNAVLRALHANEQ
ncbi:hypothetical protein H2204_001939 [Knufia peltigerae]|uniref:Xylanolytic transcriptional activator regulatory domain-containing protein n=1 Tax=Knufia peltigerae TaxID=1002370 RepID=A0AA39D3I9_9EURO|nr:hypothetical protein H2204_001939 [Knufia peltigerae]